MGHHLPGPRLTGAGIWLIAWNVGAPVLAVGLAMDLALQWLFGWCVGLWCMW